MGFLQNQRILVTGGAGFLGSAVCDQLFDCSPAELFAPRSAQYDLREQAEVRRLLSDVQPTVIIHLAAVVGGIEANSKNPGRYFYDNAVMGLHLMEEARRAGVKKFVAVGTICSYPKNTPVPFHEEDLWSGYPEETNAPYGLAKKMLLVQAQAYRRQYGFNAITLLPVNLYGPGDNFDKDTSHVIPALIRKAVEARDAKRDHLDVWGSGAQSREFLFVRDAARAIVSAAEHYDQPEPVNIGSGREIKIRDLAELICELCGFSGEIRWDTTKPDGQFRRCLDTSRAAREFGFEASTSFRDGLKETIAWYEQHAASVAPPFERRPLPAATANASAGENGNGRKTPLRPRFRDARLAELNASRPVSPESQRTLPRPHPDSPLSSPASPVSRRALITGITGQDGSYLAELLLAKGYEVHGVIRRSSSIHSTWRLDGIYQDPHESYRRLFLHYADLTDANSLTGLVLDTEPDEIYHLGAQSHVRVSFDNPAYTVNVGALGTMSILEAARLLNKRKTVRFYQAASSEMFGGDPRTAPQSEATLFSPRSPYACAKVYAFHQTVNYREAYDLFACNGILFNHESERRGETFVTRKITMAAARIREGLQDKLYLGNLAAQRDWGYAKDYVEAMWLMLQRDDPDDYVIATGETHSVEEFLEAAFEYVDRNWRDHVEIDPRYFRPAEVNLLCGDASKARDVLGWEPTTSFSQLVQVMMKSDWRRAKEELAVDYVQHGWND